MSGVPYAAEPYRGNGYPETTADDTQVTAEPAEPTETPWQVIQRAVQTAALAFGFKPKPKWRRVLDNVEEKFKALIVAAFPFVALTMLLALDVALWRWAVR